MGKAKISVGIVSVFCLFALVLGVMPSRIDMDIDQSKYTNILSKDVLPHTDKILSADTKSVGFSQTDKAVGDDFGYEGEACIPADGETLTYEIQVEEDGMYQVLLDTYNLTRTSQVPVHLTLKVNDQVYRQEDSDRIQLNQYYLYDTADVQLTADADQMINTIYTPQVWESYYLCDDGMETNRLTLQLEKGKNTLEVTKISGEVAFGNISILPLKQLDTYEAYRKKHADAKEIDTVYYLQAEDITFKNEKTINPVYEPNINITPYSLDVRYLNAVDGSTFKDHNNSIGYQIDIKEEGLYRLGFNYRSGDKKNASVYTNIYINGKMPFDTFRNLEFPYAKEYTAMLTDEYVFLEEGINYITIEINQQIVAEIHKKLETIYDRISEIAIDMRMLTGNKVDKNRAWSMEDYFPTLQDELKAWMLELEEIMVYIDGMNSNQKTEESLNIQLAIEQIQEILKDFDQLPNEMDLFSSGNNSVSARVSAVMGKLQYTPLYIDAIYFGNDSDNLPTRQYGIVAKAQNSIKKLLKSYQLTDKQLEEREIEVWVKRARPNVEIMQRMIDEEFTNETGIKVKLSVLVDQSKLTMANAAGTNPDVVTGVDSYYVSDIGQRGALEDLKQYANAKDLVRQVTPGSMLQMYVEDSLYGIPESQEFYFTMYRQDILDNIGIEVPNTWEDVQHILPVLQRYGMNFYTPLSQESALKVYPATAPFFYQHGATIFAEDGLSTNIGSEEGLKAFELMTDLVVVNGMSIQVASFYESFRDGEIPMGVTRFSDYIKLYHAAPEIMGKWSVALAPGVERDGEIDRTVTGDSSAVMMFKNSTKKEASWEFIQWWLKPETQIEYLTRLQNSYGPEYVYIPANLKALDYLPFPKEHIEVFKEQISWVEEVPRIPGGYVAEREISDAFMKVVNEGKDIRGTLNDKKTIIDRELKRKMEEFGYLKDGQVVKPYKVETKESIESWLRDEED